MWRLSVLLVVAADAALMPLGGQIARGVGSRPAVRRASAAPTMSEKLIVTDGTDSFYASRGVFQTMFEYGDFEKITAFSSSVVDAKKMCISRQARYSGLIDVLDFKEGGEAELSAAFGEASAWVAINADEDTIASQLAAAQSAGVKRAFVHLAASEASSITEDAIASAVAGGSMTYSVMRTGGWAKKGGGGGLLVSDFDTPACDELPADDTFRFMTEALTLTESYGRSFSLCPSTDASQLKEMRLAGCTRREEVQALLKGVIKEKPPEVELTEEQIEAKEEEDKKSTAEEEAQREEELQATFARLKKRGEEEAIRQKEEEEEKAKARAERLALFKDAGITGIDGMDDEGGDEPAKPEAKDEGGDGGGDGAAGGGSAPSPPAPTGGADGGDGDGLQPA